MLVSTPKHFNLPGVLRYNAEECDDVLVSEAELLFPIGISITSGEGDLFVLKSIVLSLLISAVLSLLLSNVLSLFVSVCLSILVSDCLSILDSFFVVLGIAGVIVTSESFGSEKCPSLSRELEDTGFGFAILVNEISTSFLRLVLGLVSIGTRWQISLLSGFRPRFRLLRIVGDDDDDGDGGDGGEVRM
jgi:hypothetical protein